MRQCMRFHAQIVTRSSLAASSNIVAGLKPHCRAFATTHESSLFDAIRAPSKPGVLLAFHSDNHEVPLEEKHRFPMSKYRLTRLALEGDATVKDLMEIREVELPRNPCPTHMQNRFSKFIFKPGALAEWRGTVFRRHKQQRRIWRLRMTQAMCGGSLRDSWTQRRCDPLDSLGQKVW